MKFTNTKYFSEAGNYYLKNGIYTKALPNTIEHSKFWDEEKRRCIEGYTIGDTEITGDHYFYLNYSPIRRVVYDKGGNVTKNVSKKVSLPDFWDGDYEFFWCREIAKNGIDENKYKSLQLKSKIKHLSGGRHLICGKSRRKGFSFKTGSIALKEYLFNRKSQTLIASFEEKYAKDTFVKAKEYSDHLNSIAINSPFAKRKLINSVADLHMKSGFKKSIDGIEVDAGFLSEIVGVTFQNNPDASRGKDPNLVIFEEAGTFANLKDAFRAVEPSLKDGDYVTGQAIIFGTGGDMEYGTLEFNEMYYNPEPYDMLAFENIWDEEYSDQTCGFFFPVYLNKVGHIDDDGNSNIESAIQSEKAKRELIKKTAKDKQQLVKYIVEQPFTPKEAFSISSTNIFNVYELDLHLRSLEANPTIDSTGIRGFLTVGSAGNIEFVKDDTLIECGFPVTEKEKHAGAIVIYEFPPTDGIPETLYIAGLDPYAKDQAVYSSSLGACYIYKRSTINNGTGDRLVASYIGRPETLKQYHEAVRRLLLFYNAKCLYENQINSFKEFLENKNCLYLLAETPTCLKATKNIIRKGYGQTMNKDVKLELETYLAEWLLEINSEGVPNYKFIYDKALIKELISYNDKGNFDRVISLMLCILYKIQLTKIIIEERKKVIKDSFLTRRLFSNRHING
jgi:hypothetical protein